MWAGLGSLRDSWEGSVLPLPASEATGSRDVAAPPCPCLQVLGTRPLLALDLLSAFLS